MKGQAHELLEPQRVDQSALESVYRGLLKPYLRLYIVFRSDGQILSNARAMARRR